jgi:hypothetical protein
LENPLWNQFQVLADARACVEPLEELKKRAFERGSLLQHSGFLEDELPLSQHKMKLVSLEPAINFTTHLQTHANGTSQETSVRSDNAASNSASASTSSNLSILAPPEPTLLSLSSERRTASLVLLPLDWWTDPKAYEIPLHQHAQKPGVYRLSFVTSERELLETVALGFQGLFAPCGKVDHFELQLLIETARDFFVSFVPMISCHSELKTVLETDSRYVCMGNPVFQTNAEIYTLVKRLRSAIPKSLFSFVSLSSNPPPALLSLLLDNGIKSIVYPF